MILRSLGTALAACLVAALVAACSPPAATEPSAAEPGAEAGAQSAPQEAAGKVAVAPAAKRPERRLASSANEPAATQYRYIDERGNLMLASRLEDIPERQRSTATALNTPPPRAPLKTQDDETRSARTADVTIYSTRSCPYCRAAMAHFDKIGLDYVNRDIEEDEEARAEYLEVTGGRRGVPVIVVGDAWMQGWSQPEFDRLLASAR